MHAEAWDYFAPAARERDLLEPLRQHPSLQTIALGEVGPYRPAAEFWADYDAQQAAQKK